jgi:hypothetical protein
MSDWCLPTGGSGGGAPDLLVPGPAEIGSLGHDLQLGPTANGDRWTSTTSPGDDLAALSNLTSADGRVIVSGSAPVAKPSPLAVRAVRAAP